MESGEIDTSLGSPNAMGENVLDGRKTKQKGRKRVVTAVKSPKKGASQIIVKLEKRVTDY